MVDDKLVILKVLSQRGKFVNSSPMLPVWAKISVWPQVLTSAKFGEAEKTHTGDLEAKMAHNPQPSRVNLDTCFTVKTVGSRTVAGSLPVLIDLNWYGPTMTSENAGIIPSRSATLQTRTDSDDEVIL